jgi:nickel-dependent lactate racemase
VVYCVLLVTLRELPQSFFHGQAEQDVIEQTIPFGSREVSFSLPEGRLLARLETRTPPPSDPAEQMIQRSLKQPIGSQPLRELAKGKRSAAILIPRSS